MTTELDPATAENYQLLVDSGDRTWEQVATTADHEHAPDLAAYARARAKQQAPEAAAATPRASTSSTPASDGR